VRNETLILGPQICVSQTQITYLCLCITNTKLILGTLQYVRRNPNDCPRPPVWCCTIIIIMILLSSHLSLSLPTMEARIRATRVCTIGLASSRPKRASSFSANAIVSAKNKTRAKKQAGRGAKGGGGHSSSGGSRSSSSTSSSAADDETTTIETTRGGTLFYDIVWQTRLPARISAVDADNCYDRIAHPIASLVFQALGVKKEACKSIFITIQDMKFFLRTGFGDSKEYASATGEIKTQGMCQGNGAAPAGWTLDSIVMISAHKRKRHGLHLRSPITNKRIHLAGTLFVDDTDVEHLDLNKSETRDEAHQALQDSIINWGHLLNATSGALKLGK
jgi:hypothetical protein